MELRTIRSSAAPSGRERDESQEGKSHGAVMKKKAGDPKIAGLQVRLKPDTTS